MPLPAIGAALAAGQAVLGGIQAISGSGRAKRLAAQRQAYQTPEEYNSILQASQSRAAQGFDPKTLEYLTSQTDRSFASALGTASRLGADPNALSGLFDQRIQSMMRIGAENQAQNMANFGKYLSAVEMMGKNEEAEWLSQENILKDQMQAAGADKQAGLQNLGSSMNAFISMDASSRMEKLFKDAPKSAPGRTPYSDIIDRMRQAAAPVLAPITPNAPTIDQGLASTAGVSADYSAYGSPNSREVAGRPASATSGTLGQLSGGYRSADFSTYGNTNSREVANLPRPNVNMRDIVDKWANALRLR